MNLFEMSKAVSTKFEPVVPKGQELYLFQKAGTEFCLKVQKSLLADDMGLGKTAQAIATMNTSGIDKYIVVCPASLCDNWKREIERWSTGIYEPHIFINKRNTPKKSILILSFGLTHNFDTVSKIIINYKFNGLILDECHYLSSLRSKRSRVLYGKNGLFDRSDITVAISGTPITNKPLDFFPIVNRLNPEALGVSNIAEFGEKYAHKYLNPFSNKIEYRGSKNEKELGFKLRSSVMIRREKGEVLKDLPAKTRRLIYLSSDREEMQNLIIKENELYDDFLATKKIIRNEDSTFRVRSQLAILKAPQVVNYCRLILLTKEKIVIFGWHREMILRCLTGLAKYNPVVLTGATPNCERIKRIDKFQNDESCRVFIGAISAAGIGITLTASDYGIMAESSWVPSQNIQCEDRLNRIGQKNAVQIDYLAFQNSVDEKVLKVVGSKSSFIKSILDSSQFRDDPF